MIELEEITNLTKKQARAIVESGQEHQPIMLVFSPEGANIIHLVEIKKDKFKQAISTLLRKLNAYAYIFVNEAWGTKLAKDSPITKRLLNGEISVSELPLDDREEILTIMVAENGKSFNAWSAKIRYTSEDKRYLGEWEEMGDIARGRLVLREW